MARRAKHGNQTTQLSSLKLRLLEKLQEEGCINKGQKLCLSYDTRFLGEVVVSR
jgi:hypothetical protein